MKLVRGLHNLRPEHRGCVATIGNFDGVHLGHQAVLENLAEQGSALQLPVTLITFEPQPREYFTPADVPARLTRLREKLEVLATCPIERVLCLHFNDTLAALTADQFIQRILVQGLGVQYLLVGDDFRFGRGRTGDRAQLQQAGQQHGFQLATMDDFILDGERVSSTRIREALQAGELERAAALLGRTYAICGRVAHGDKRGRTIGFPTANVFLHRSAVPVAGVFAVELLGIDKKPLAGVANVGVRPTVGGNKALLEVHLFDFERDIYGRQVQVRLLKRLRAERKFESFDLLKAQIQLDAEQAQAFFSGSVS